MAFSIGQNFFNDLLDYSNNGQSSDNMDTVVALQARLSQFYKNNPGQVLTKSMKFSGEENSLGEKVPLGGQIIYSKSNIGNAQGSNFYSKEFDFWNCEMGKDSENKKELGDTEEDDREKKSDEEYDDENQNLSITEPSFKRNLKLYGHNLERFTDMGGSNRDMILLMLLIIIVLVAYFAFKYNKGRLL